VLLAQDGKALRILPDEN
jgi:cold shock CspA family protein